MMLLIQKASANEFIIKSIEYLCGGFDSLIIAVLFFMFISYCSEELARYILDSPRTPKYMARKGFYILFLLVGVQLDYALEIEFFRTLVLFYIIGNEGIALIQNSIACDFEIPSRLIALFEKMRNKRNKDK